jgi:hypothetical protein
MCDSFVHRGEAFFPSFVSGIKETHKTGEIFRLVFFWEAGGGGDEIKMDPQLIYVNSTYLPGVPKVET